MARETDFIDLYRSLGVKPGCGLAEFKQAYRRRVAVLHPDRQQPQGEPHLAAADELQRLTALYGEAMEFQRCHGRLPGAIAPTSTSALGAAAPTTPPPAQSGAPSRSRPRFGLLIVLAVAIIAAWSWFGSPVSPPEEPEAASTPPISSTRASIPRTVQVAPFEDSGGDALDDPGAVPLLERGMPWRTVRAIEGEPMLISEALWEYGPSWIRFEHGKVVDWYSSPLRPLKVANARPHAPAQD